MGVYCCLKARRESELAKSKMQPNSAHKVGEDLADHKVGEDFEDHSYGVGDCHHGDDKLIMNILNKKNIVKKE